MIFTALFTNLDGIIKAENIDAGIFERFFSAYEGDEEVIITKKEYDEISKFFPGRVKRLGGNAANASVALSEISIQSVLSMPSRNPEIVKFVPDHVRIVCGKSLSRADKCVREGDDVFEHIIIETDEGRKILTYDRMSSELRLDKDFWGMIRKAELIYISGFHLVLPEYTERIKEVCDMLAECNARVWLEAGSMNKSMYHAIKLLLDSQVITHFGMNDSEALRLAKYYGVDTGERLRACSELAENMFREHNIHVSVHARDFRMFADKDIKKYAKACKLSIDICARMSAGWKSAHFVKSGIKPERHGDVMIIPTLINPEPVVITGMGDRAAITEFVFSNGIYGNAIKNK